MKQAPCGEHDSVPWTPRGWLCAGALPWLGAGLADLLRWCASGGQASRRRPIRGVILALCPGEPSHLETFAVGRGKVLGASDRLATFPRTAPYTPADLAANILQSLGVATSRTLTDAFGRPFPVNSGDPIPLA